MKANLYSRMNLRLRWFTLEGVPFLTERKLELSYDPSSAEENLHEYTPDFAYTFTGVEKEIPASDIIIFEDELPTTYARTQGSRGKKFSTDPQPDPFVRVKDRIVELKKGKETIKREPPEYPDPRVKEVELRERDDEITRKLTFENEGLEPAGNCEFKFISTKDVRFVESVPSPTAKEPPEYAWRFEVPPEATFSVELRLTTHVRKTFKIEKGPDPVPHPHPRAPRRLRAQLNQFNDQFDIRQE
ncbi:MAG: hypothetical protein ACTSU5_14415 [Promethearchaeota archaeon]